MGVQREYNFPLFSGRVTAPPSLLQCDREFIMVKKPPELNVLILLNFKGEQAL